MKSNNIIAFIDKIKGELEIYLTKNNIDDIDVDMKKYKFLKYVRNNGLKSLLRKEKMLFRIFTLVIVIIMFITLYILYYTVNNAKIIEKKVFIEVIKDKELEQKNNVLLIENKSLKDNIKTDNIYIEKLEGEIDEYKDNDSKKIKDTSIDKNIKEGLKEDTNIIKGLKNDIEKLEGKMDELKNKNIKLKQENNTLIFENYVLKGKTE